MDARVSRTALLGVPATFGAAILIDRAWFAALLGARAPAARGPRPQPLVVNFALASSTIAAQPSCRKKCCGTGQGRRDPSRDPSRRGGSAVVLGFSCARLLRCASLGKSFLPFLRPTVLSPLIAFHRILSDERRTHFSEQDFRGRARRRERKRSRQGEQACT